MKLKYRTQIFEEEIYPIGDEPNGKALTGFISINTSGTKGLILVFREIGAPKSASFDIPYIKQPITLKKIGGGGGEIKQLSDGCLKVKTDHPASFIIMRFSSENKYDYK